MSHGFLIHPILFLPTHSFPSRNFSGRPGLVKRTGLRAITEGLCTKLFVAGIPMVNNHLDSHLAAPDTAHMYAYRAGDGLFVDMFPDWAECPARAAALTVHLQNAPKP